jgi:stage II sporulation protein D (peptidoglycan lytic transglycosylase)
MARRLMPLLLHRTARQWRRAGRVLVCVCLLPRLMLALSDADTVRIGVLGLFHPLELVVRAAEESTLLFEIDGDVLRTTMPAALHLRALGGSVECLAGDRRWLASRVVVAESTAGFLLQVPGKIERRFAGRLEVVARGDELQAVVSMPREIAVASIVAAESQPGTRLEALKVQAIVSRSFLAAARPVHQGFDFCDTTHCQLLRQPPAPDEAASQATATTRGVTLAYEGGTVAALFSRSCGGSTRSLREAGLRPGNYPFFAVDCPSCRRRPETWQRKLPLAEAHQLMASGGAEPARLEFVRRRGWDAIPSSRYSARREGAWVVLSGVGRGHGVGLCQRGAAALAAGGMGFRAILTHYFPGVTLASIAATAAAPQGRFGRPYSVRDLGQ